MDTLEKTNRYCFLGVKFIDQVLEITEIFLYRQKLQLLGFAQFFCAVKETAEKVNKQI